LCLRFKSPGHNHKSEECQNCQGDGYDHCCSVGQGQTCTGLYLSQIKKPMRHEVHVHARLPPIRALNPEALGCDSGCGRGAWPFAVGSLGGGPGPDFLGSSAAVAAYAGLNPQQHQSGISPNRRVQISKIGNAVLRTALYMPALSFRTPKQSTSSLRTAAITICF
jgi:hypothetical protein